MIEVVVSGSYPTRTVAIAAPGPYTVPNLPTLWGYTITSYRDYNGNQSQDVWEASGSYAGSPLYLTNSASASTSRSPKSIRTATAFPTTWRSTSTTRIRTIPIRTATGTATAPKSPPAPTR